MRPTLALDVPPSAHAAVPLAALAFFGTCWGATLALTKIATSSGHHPFGLLVWRLGLGATLLGALVVCRGIRVPCDARHLRWYALIAATGMLVPGTFMLLAYRHLPASVMALLIATVPLLTLVLAIVLGAERLDPRRALGIALGSAALVLIALPEASLPSRGALLWVGVGMLGPLCYAIEGNLVATRAPPGLSPVAALFGASLVGTLVAGVAATLVGGHVDPFAPWTRVEGALVLASVGNTVAYAGYLWLLVRAGAVFASQIGYVVTVAGIVSGVLLLGERPAATVLIAVPSMLVGVALVKPRNAARHRVADTRVR